MLTVRSKSPKQYEVIYSQLQERGNIDINNSPSSLVQYPGSFGIKIQHPAEWGKEISKESYI